MKKSQSGFSKVLLTHKKKLFCLALLLCVGVWNVYKPLPEGISKAHILREVSSSSVEFIADTTYTNFSGERIKDQHIFNEVISMIRKADSYILIDMFLWNDFLGKETAAHRAISSELVSELVLKKKQNPHMIIEVITDPINTSYFGATSSVVETLAQNDIQVTLTNLPALRDSNPSFSSLWRVFVMPLNVLHQSLFDSQYTFRSIPNIINSGGDPVTLRSLLTLLNFKANHRKLIVTDLRENDIRTFISLVTSANPHDGSSSHSNVAIKVQGQIAQDIIASEQVVAGLADEKLSLPVGAATEKDGKGIFVQLVTDKAIRDSVVNTIAETKQGDTVDILMFYFSDSLIMKELIQASKRGVIVRLILDPNKDAFGMKKNGIPNRSVADSLVEESEGKISVRWCDTKGEQCHGKLLIVTTLSQKTLILGSANYTRRNIGGYNLESNIRVTAQSTYPAYQDALDYFNHLWLNDQYIFSAEYSKYKDTSMFRKSVAWIMEHTGLGTF